MNRSFTSKSIEIEDAVLTLTEKDAARLEAPINRSNIRWIRVVFVVALLILGWRAFSLSILQGSRYREQSAQNSIRSIVLPAPRGLIFDRYGTQLVQNIPSVELVAFPNELPTSSDERRVLLERLQSIISLDTDFSRDEFFSAGVLSSPLVLKQVLSRDESLLFSARALEFPGIVLERSAIRNYQDSAIFSHILGYEGRIQKEELETNKGYLLVDSIGKQGIEKSYESELRGKHGADRMQVDSRGAIKKSLGISDPEPGNDIILNIDAGLQKKSFDTLRSSLESQGLSRGSVIAIDPRDGSVLSLVSFPSFDNNLFARGIKTEEYAPLRDDPDRPLFNRAVAGEYPPGSTIKPFLASAALSEGIVSESTEIESRGGIEVSGFFFGDWKAHGFTDVRHAIAVSSDVYFYTIGGGYGNIRGLGMEKINEYERRFGFGEETGIDIPGERSGFLPTSKWKQDRFKERWYIGDTYHASIGQGFVLATPLQIAVATSVVANSGTLWKPRVVGQIRSVGGEIRTIPPSLIRDRIVDPSILKVVREGMRLTVTDGTARSLETLPVPVAGKTGTAQFGTGKKTHGWFSAFAPYENPVIAMVVLVEDQSEQETYNAVPISRDILEWYFREGHGKDSLKN